MILHRQSAKQPNSTCRPHKVETVKKTYPEYSDKLDVLAMDDMITGDWEGALKG